MIRGLALALAVSGSAFAQLPASGTLSQSDRPLFEAEVARIGGLLNTAPDKATVTYAMARTWAFAEQWPEAMDWLRKVVAMKAGIDPSRDSIFAPLRNTREFAEIAAAIRAATPAVSRSRSAFTIPEGDLVPESIAYDPQGKQFYLGSMTKGKVIRCSDAGKCTQFAGGLGVVLGLKVAPKVDGGGLWILSNTEQESALIHFDLTSAQPIGKYVVTGAGHTFNDLVLARSGDVYLTDTRAGAVWHLAKGSAALTRLPGRFDGANGIALSPNDGLLYVSTFPDGITVLDLKTNVSMPIVRPTDLCLGAIDGLYFHHGLLIAIQNGFMIPRVTRLTLNRDLRGIEGFEVMERRNPLFDGVTTGVVVGDSFFYMANIQDGKSTGFHPITILKLHL